MTLKPKQAVALRYEQHSDAAPRVVAKGAGEVAQAIIQAANQSGVSVQQDGALVSALMLLQLDDVIPPELYTVVAEVLSIVYDAKRSPSNARPSR